MSFTDRTQRSLFVQRLEATKQRLAKAKTRVTALEMEVAEMEHDLATGKANEVPVYGFNALTPNDMSELSAPTPTNDPLLHTEMYDDTA